MGGYTVQLALSNPSEAGRGKKKSLGKVRMKSYKIITLDGVTKNCQFSSDSEDHHACPMADLVNKENGGIMLSIFYVRCTKF